MAPLIAAEAHRLGSGQPASWEAGGRLLSRMWLGRSD